MRNDLLGDLLRGFLHRLVFGLVYWQKRNAEKAQRKADKRYEEIRRRGVGIAPTDVDTLERLKELNERLAKKKAKMWHHSKHIGTV